MVLATPVAKNVALLADVAAQIASHTLVTDVGSTKRTIVAAARRLSTADGSPLQFVGGHPTRPDQGKPTKYRLSGQSVRCKGSLAPVVSCAELTPPERTR